jgi:hypothetical protein
LLPGLTPSQSARKAPITPAVPPSRSPPSRNRPWKISNPVAKQLRTYAEIQPGLRGYLKSRPLGHCPNGQKILAPAEERRNRGSLVRAPTRWLFTTERLRTGEKGRVERTAETRLSDFGPLPAEERPPARPSSRDAGCRRLAAWLSAGGFILGLVETFLNGVYAGLVFTPIYDIVARRCG